MRALGSWYDWANKLTEEDLRGEGLTAEEIASSPEIGAWTEGEDEQSGAEYVEMENSGHFSTLDQVAKVQRHRPGLPEPNDRG